MAKYTRIETALTMKDSGIVPVFYHPDPEVCKNVLKAVYDGGLRVFEFTNRGDGAHEIFTSLLKFANENLPGMILGVGSIVDPASAAQYIQTGANFVVSPILNAEVAKVCNRRKISWSPGCGSATEISFAEELGAEVVKIFPAGEVGGPSFLKNIKGPMPWSSIMPSGGVDPSYENLSKWFAAGAWCVGMGSNLFPKAELKAGDFTSIRNRVSEAVKLLARVRKELNSQAIDH
ncbi:MAG: bifunctional 4-hydroxy-2-oxoglutarate aldolase/2-dehydro-3-deoxy-phosphogluconate aldolase [Bacteroidales bacterium]|nr:bifunctional 4-hydroxy-2-oxoglutarate aldolase/2-dehydro-3-deoxy-phosphogluconate aldolase [Bacteroidales bacterium]